MPRFFVEKSLISEDTVTVTGADAFHISRSLRMAKGEQITVCDGEGSEYLCELTDFSDNVTARIIKKESSKTEPPFRVTLWQALPKGDKLDGIIQKSVECGVYEIRLFESERCVVKTDEKNEQKKSERRNRIALEAAKQSGRGIIPKVYPAVSFDKMLEAAKLAELPIFCYEGQGTQPLGGLLGSFGRTCPESICVVVGSEGGFSESEAERAKNAGMRMAGLGPRILRTETAPLFVLGALVTKFELS